MSEEINQPDGWTEWSRYVLAEIKRMADSVERLDARQDSMNESLMEYNSELRLHIKGVKSLEERTDLISEELSEYRNKTDGRLENAEKPFEWASMAGTLLKYIGLATTVAIGIYGLYKAF